MVEAEMSWVREAKDHRKGSLMPFIFLMGSLQCKRDRLEIFVKVKEVREELPSVEGLGKNEALVDELLALGV
jgi:hypothetical protein